MVEDIFEWNPKTFADDSTVAGFIPMEMVDAGYGYRHTFEKRKWGEIKKGYSHFQNGDIGIAKISPCFENRKSTIFSNLPNGIGAGTTELTVLRGYQVYPEYFLFLFQSAWYISEGTKFFKGVVGQQRVNKDIFTTLVLPIPPLAEQRRIVSAIKLWLNVINDIEKSQKDLQDYVKQVKSKVLDFAIHGKLVPQDPNEEPAIELLKRINPHFIPCDTSHYENLPETWCVALMGEVYNHTTGKALKKADLSGELRQYITTSNVYWNSFDFTEVRSMYFTEKELDKCTAHKGDLLVCNGGDVGRAAIWDYDYDICYQNHISRLRPKSADIVFNPFYNYLFRYLKDKGQLNGKGVAITSLSAADIQSLAIPLPPLVEQKRIVERIETIFTKLDTITAEL